MRKANVVTKIVFIGVIILLSILMIFVLADIPFKPAQQLRTWLYGEEIEGTDREKAEQVMEKFADFLETPYGDFTKTYPVSTPCFVRQFRYAEAQESTNYQIVLEMTNSGKFAVRLYEKNEDQYSSVQSQGFFVSEKFNRAVIGLKDTFPSGSGSITLRNQEFAFLSGNAQFILQAHRPTLARKYAVFEEETYYFNRYPSLYIIQEGNNHFYVFDPATLSDAPEFEASEGEPSLNLPLCS